MRLQPREGAEEPGNGDLQAEIEALSKATPEQLAAISIQSHVRMAKSLDEIRDTFLDIADMVEELLEKLGGNNDPKSS